MSAISQGEVQTYYTHKNRAILIVCHIKNADYYVFYHPWQANYGSKSPEMRPKAPPETM